MFQWIPNRRWNAAPILLLTLALGWLLAHEGHAPLPTQGVRVDLKKGEILLTKESHHALDIRTVEISNHGPDESIPAYVTLMIPWQNHAFASNRLPGRIVRLLVQAGETVQEGQLLAEIESSELESLHLEMMNAENELNRNQKILETLHDSGAVTPERVRQDAELLVEQNRNDLLIAREKWASLDLPPLESKVTPSIPRLPIRAPITGQVIHADLSVGKIVERGEHLFEIMNPKEIWARIGVLEQDLNRVQRGQAVSLKLTAFPDREIRTTIETVGFEIDPKTHQNFAWAKLQNREEASEWLLPGMYGTAKIQIQSAKSGLMIPATALIDDGVDTFVLVETASAQGVNEYQRKSIEVIRRTPEWVEFRSVDLFAGDRVVTQGSHELGGLFVSGVLKLSPETKRSIGLKFEPMQSIELDEVLEIPGQVDLPPQRRSIVTAPIAGTLQQIFVQPGQRVESGQVLAEILSLEFLNTQLELLRESLAGQLYEKQWRQLNDARQIVPKRKLIEIESARQQTQNRIQSLLRKLEIYGLSQQERDQILQTRKPMIRLPIRATNSAVLIQFDKTIGQSIRSEEPLFTLHDPQQPWIQGFVSEQEFSRIREGAIARIRTVSQPSTVLTGIVKRSSQTFGLTHRTLSIWVQLDNANATELRHNQIANLHVAINRIGSVHAVPLSAIDRDGLDAFVFVEKSDATIERRSVQLGRSDDRFVEIRSGLALGDRVATAGVRELQTAYASVR